MTDNNNNINEDFEISQCEIGSDISSKNNLETGENKEKLTYTNRNFKPHTHQMEEILIGNNNNINERDENDGNNNWTKRNYDTVRGWQSDIEKSSLIHGEILNMVFNNLQTFSVVCLVMGTLITLFSALSITLQFLDMKIVPIIFNILVLISGAVITILMGIIKIKNWENLLIILAKLVEKLDSTWFLIDTELSIEPSQRVNAIDFIKRCDGEYTFLMRQYPPINPDTYTIADKKYKERLYNNHTWMLNFRHKAKLDSDKLYRDNDNKEKDELTVIIIEK